MTRTMTDSSKEQSSGIAALGNMILRYTSNSSLNPGETSDGTPGKGDSTTKTAGDASFLNMEHVLSPFESADDLEQGIAEEAVLAKNANMPAQLKEPMRRCCIFHVDPVEECPSPSKKRTVERFHLLSETGDMLLTAKYVRTEGQIEFFLPEDDKRMSPMSRLKRTMPVFTMIRNEKSDAWVLCQTFCQHCSQRPKHLSCEFLGKSQQVAFIRHSKVKLCEGSSVVMHNVDVKIPRMDGTQSMVWCPVTLGRDLCERCPRPGDRSPGSTGRRHVRQPSSGSNSSPRHCSSYRSQGSQGSQGYPSEGSEEDIPDDPLQLGTLFPEWDEVVKCLVLNFKDRRVQSSPMNFMLCTVPKGSKELVMQHAKLSNNTYCLDFAHPLSTAQAFAISLTALLWD